MGKERDTRPAGRRLWRMIGFSEKHSHLHGVLVCWVPHGVRRVMLVIMALFAIGLSQAGFPASIDDFLLRNFDVGGDFALTDQYGRKTSLGSFEGKVVLLFFGFTHCPDVCPTTMADMGRVLGSLGDDAKRVRAVFVTVDPDRDTPERLKRYLSFFHEAIIGVTGSVEEIEGVANKYSSSFRKRESANGVDYSVDHSSFVYILDQKGKVRYVLPYTIGAKMMLEGVRSLLDGTV